SVLTVVDETNVADRGSASTSAVRSERRYPYGRGSGSRLQMTSPGRSSLPEECGQVLKPPPALGCWIFATPRRGMTVPWLSTPEGWGPEFPERLRLQWDDGIRFFVDSELRRLPLHYEHLSQREATIL